MLTKSKVYYSTIWIRTISYLRFPHIWAIHYQIRLNPCKTVTGVLSGLTSFFPNVLYFKSLKSIWTHITSPLYYSWFYIHLYNNLRVCVYVSVAQTLYMVDHCMLSPPKVNTMSMVYKISLFLLQIISKHLAFCCKYDYLGDNSYINMKIHQYLFC